MTAGELKRALKSVPDDLPIVIDYAVLSAGHDEPGEGHVDQDGYADLLSIGLAEIERGSREVDVVWLALGLEEAPGSSARLPRSSETRT